MTEETKRRRREWDAFLAAGPEAAPDDPFWAAVADHDRAIRAWVMSALPSVKEEA